MTEVFEPAPPSGGAAQAAPPLARLLASLIDAMLAIALVLGLRLAAIQGWIRPLGAWRPGASETWFDVPALLLALGLLMLREIPFGQSFAQWLLCLRPVHLDGTRLSRRERWQRALSPLLPGIARSGRHATRWLTVSYMPARAGLALRGALAAVAAAWSLAWGIETLRPSIGRADAERVVRSTLLQDPTLRRELGEPLEFEIGTIAPRRQRMLESGVGEFQVGVRGTQQRQDMVVRAVRIDGRWAIDEITDIRIAALDSSPGDTVAAR